MKHLKILTLLFTIALFFACSEKELTDTFSIKDFSYSDCKNLEKKAIETETIHLKTVNSNYLKITHSNAIFACCPNGELKADASFTNDTIILNEYTTDQSCNCLCPYDLEYTIGKLNYGEYTVVMQISSYDYFTFNINFNSNTDTTIIIKQ